MAQLRCALHGAPDIIRCGLEVLLAPYSDRVLLVGTADPGGIDVHLVDLVSGLLGAGTQRSLESAGATTVSRALVGLTVDVEPTTLRRAQALGVVRIVPLVDVGPHLVEVLEEVHRAPDGAGDPRTIASALDGHDLSPREVDVLTAICAGMSNEQIARHLFVSVNSVKTYVRSAYRKIGVVSRTQAMLWGMDHGL